MSGPPPLVFLVGPPGAGKTTLGQGACRLVGRSFGQLASPETMPPDALIHGRPPPRCSSSHGRSNPTAPACGERASAAPSSSYGPTPLAMAGRAARPATLTPRAGLSTGGGFGRTGTSALEFRRLERASNATLLVDGLSVDEAVDGLARLILQVTDPTVEEERNDALARWLVATWDAANAQSARSLADAMSAMIAHRRASGASARMLRELQIQLQIAGLLYFSSVGGRRGTPLSDFRRGDAGRPIEFAHKVSRSPPAMARYANAVTAFARFLDDTDKRDG